MMGKGAKAGVVLLWACAFMAAVAGPVFAQNKELSDKSVLTLMRYAWGMVPEKFTTPTGKTIIVDKSKASEAIVPLDTAREAGTQVHKPARLVRLTCRSRPDR